MQAYCWALRCKDGIEKEADRKRMQERREIKGVGGRKDRGHRESRAKCVREQPNGAPEG